MSNSIWFTIKQRDGKTVTGVVHGSGGTLHGEGKAARQEQLKRLRGLIRAATEGRPLWAYEPETGHVKVYPDYNFYSGGKTVNVDLRGATATMKPEGYTNKRGRQARLIVMARKLADKEWGRASLISRGDEPVEKAFKTGPSATIVQRRLGGLSDEEHIMFTDIFHEHLRHKKYRLLGGGKRRHSSVDRLEANIDKLLK